MEYVIKKDITGILRKALNIIKKEDLAALDELSDHAIKDASIFQFLLFKSVLKSKLVILLEAHKMIIFSEKMMKKGPLLL